jgi:single-strand DNA-binding protein
MLLRVSTRIRISIPALAGRHTENILTVEVGMAGVNKAILLGNLGRDPEVRRTPAGTSVASFTLATTERYTDKSGQKQDKTEWHNIVAWGRLAELAGQYLKKGRTVYIEGRITNRSWDDKDGNKKYKSEINAQVIQFLGGPGGGGAGEARGGAQPAVQAAAAPADEFDIPDAVAEPNGGAPADDLPF